MAMVRATPFVANSASDSVGTEALIFCSSLVILTVLHSSFRPSSVDLQSQNPQRSALRLRFCSIRSTEFNLNLGAITMTYSFPDPKSISRFRK